MDEVEKDRLDREAQKELWAVMPELPEVSCNALQRREGVRQLFLQRKDGTPTALQLKVLFNS